MEIPGTVILRMGKNNADRVAASKERGTLDMKKHACILLLVCFLAGCGGDEAAPATAALPAPDAGTAVQDGGYYNPDEETLGTDDFSYSDETDAQSNSSIPDDFWHEASWQYTDNDGYKIGINVRLSDMISIDAQETLTDAWLDLGGDPSDIPDVEKCKQISSSWKIRGFESAYYIVGDFSIVNLTEGFGFSPEKTYSIKNSSGYAYGFNLGYITHGDSRPFELLNQSGFVRLFFQNGVDTLVTGGAYGRVYSTDNAICPTRYPIMDSNQWGPTRILIVIPNTRTPNSPNGIEDLDDCYWTNWSTWGMGEEYFNQRYTGEHITYKFEKIE